MQQAVHILKKDVRYLWRELALLLVLAGSQVFGGGKGWTEALLLVTAGYVITRVIHAEAIPGDQQFWITRPYRWTSLVCAKLLFVVFFIHLPVMVTQLAIVLNAGFSFFTIAAGLVWSQVLLFLCFSLPVATLAALTSSLVGWILSALVLIASGFSMQQMIWPRFRFVPPTAFWPISVEWMRLSIGAVMLAAVMLVVLYVQYRRRFTWFSRVFAATGTVAALAVYGYIPWLPAMALQTRLSSQPDAGAAINISLEPSLRRSFRQPPRLPGVLIELPLVVKGIPENIEVHFDGLAFTIESPAGQWTSDNGAVNRRTETNTGVRFDGSVVVNSTFFQAASSAPATLRGTAYFTVYGNERSEKLNLAGPPEIVAGNLRCGLGAFDYVLCGAPFRWPARMIYAKVGPNDVNALYRLISYSPFPASLGLNPMEVHWATGPPSSRREVTILVKEPLAHLKRDFEVRGVDLPGFPGHATRRINWKGPV